MGGIFNRDFTGKMTGIQLRLLKSFGTESGMNEAIDSITLEYLQPTYKARINPGFSRF